MEINPNKDENVKMKLSKLLLIPVFCVFFGFSSWVSSQAPPMEWGKIQRADFAMDSTLVDSNASAIILCNYGTANIEDNFKVVFTKHKRIKILSEGGYDLATVNISFQKKASDRRYTQKIKDIEAQTFFLGEDGSIKKIRLNKKSIFEQDVDGKWFEKRFTLPKLQPGVIIEYKYKIISKHPTFLPTWEFQEGEPTAWSEYRVKIPGALEYLFMFQGYQPFHIRDNTPFKHSMGVEYDDTLVAKYGLSKKRRVVLNSTGLSYRFAMKDIPALRDEPYVTTLEDYTAKLSFQLSKYIFSEEDEHDVLGSWSDINETLLKNEKFGAQIQKYSQLKKRARQIIGDVVKQQEKMELIYHYIGNSIKWDGAFRYIPSKNLDEVYKTRIGNSAEITLLLISMLRDVGLNAVPVLTSTRGHGKISKTQILEQFNHVLAFVKLDNDDFVLDATDPLRSIDYLPVSVLKKSGRIIDVKNSRWIEFKSSKKEIQNSLVTIKLSADGSMSGSLSVTFKEYGALFARRALREKGNAENVFRELLNISDEIEMDSLHIRNEKLLHEPLLIDFKLKSSNSAQVSGNHIYLDLVLADYFPNNPLELKTRTFPVDFPHGRKMTYVLNLEAPEGYDFIDLPRKSSIRLPDKAGQFLFLTQENGNKLSLRSSLVLNRTFFKPAMYLSLRQFFDRIVSSHSSQIVLKKSDDTAGK